MLLKNVKILFFFRKKRLKKDGKNNKKIGTLRGGYCYRCAQVILQYDIYLQSYLEQHIIPFKTISNAQSFYRAEETS